MVFLYFNESRGSCGQKDFRSNPFPLSCHFFSSLLIFSLFFSSSLFSFSAFLLLSFIFFFVSPLIFYFLLSFSFLIPFFLSFSFLLVLVFYFYFSRFQARFWQCSKFTTGTRATRETLRCSSRKTRPTCLPLTR